MLDRAVTATPTRWIVLALLFAATAISYIDRQTLSVIAPVIRDDLGITNADYGYLITCFLFAYTIMQSVTGWFIDRFGTRTGFAVIMGWWSIATILHAFGDGLTSFAIYRILLGAGEAGSWAACVKAVSQWFPVRERGLANSVWGSGVSAGQIVSVPLIAWITIALHWRVAFVVTGLFGLLWLAAWLRYFRDPVQEQASTAVTALSHRHYSEVEPISTGRTSYLQLLKSRNVWAIFLARVLLDPCAWFYNYWTPNYLSQSTGFTMQEIGRYAWIPFAFQGLGLLLGGFMSDWLWRRGVRLFYARFSVMIVAVLLAVPALLLSQKVSVGAVLATISVAMFGFGLWAPNLMTLIGDSFPRSVVGSVTGLSGVGAGMGGMFFMFITGEVVEKFGFGPIFVAAATIPILAILVLYTLFDHNVAGGLANSR